MPRTHARGPGGKDTRRLRPRFTSSSPRVVASGTEPAPLGPTALIVPAAAAGRSTRYVTSAYRDCPSSRRFDSKLSVAPLAQRLDPPRPPTTRRRPTPERAVGPDTSGWSTAAPLRPSP